MFFTQFYEKEIFEKFHRKRHKPMVAACGVTMAFIFYEGERQKIVLMTVKNKNKNLSILLILYVFTQFYEKEIFKNFTGSEGVTAWK